MRYEFTKMNMAQGIGRYVRRRHFGVFFVFFRIYVNLWYTAIKTYFFCLFGLFAHYYWYKWSHHCRIKRVICFEWHFYHLLWGFPSLDFSQLRKMMAALAFNFMIAATNAWIGKWNRHAVAPPDNFFYKCAIFKKICKKMKIDYVHCPMRKFWRTSLRPFGQNNVGISKKWHTWERLH